MGGTLSNSPILQKKLSIRYIRELTKDTKLVSGKNRIGSICHKHGAPRVFSLVFAGARKVIQGTCLIKRTSQKEGIDYLWGDDRWEGEEINSFSNRGNREKKQ